MASATHDEREEIRAAIRSLCKRFPETYWRQLDAERRYPDEFINALTEAGWLSILVPEEYGGAGLGMSEAGIILEEINRSGATAAPCHAQMYTMGTLLRHGSEKQKEAYLPEIAAGRLRLQSFGVTEPNAGSDVTSITTVAKRHGDRYVVNGRKVFISRVQHSDLLMLLCRTAPLSEVKRKTDGLSVLLVDLRTAGGSIEIRPIETMVNHETNDLTFDDLEVPADQLIGEEGKGFEYILSGMNAERILIASESVGDGRYFVERATTYANERVVFGKPIGQYQGVQFPIADAHMRVMAAGLVRDRAAAAFDRNEPVGADANIAKYLASEAAWQAANVAMTTFGGYGLAVEYDLERKFREARLLMIAPVTNNLVLAHVGQHVLGMPRSY